MAGIIRKNSEDAFHADHTFLWKQNGWIKGSENIIKDIIGISNACWHVHLRWGTK